nr:hypothetical protein [Tanacetum cinerariifolium]
MPKSNNDKKNTNPFKRTARISVRACCFVKSPLSSPPHLSPSTEYQTAPPPTPIESPPSSPIAPSRFSPDHFLNTPKTTPPPLTSPPPAPSQPSKENSTLDINLEHVNLIFCTPPTSPYPFFDSLIDLPPRTTSSPHPQPSLNSIERLAKQPPPMPEILEPLFHHFHLIFRAGTFDFEGRCHPAKRTVQYGSTEASLSLASNILFYRYSQSKAELTIIRSLTLSFVALHFDTLISSLSVTPPF